MEPAAFDEANTVLGPPPGVSERDVSSLNVFRGCDDAGQPIVVSCWKVTREELAEINRTGRVWLGIVGQTMPPAWVVGVKPFHGPTQETQPENDRP